VRRQARIVGIRRRGIISNSIVVDVVIIDGIIDIIVIDGIIDIIVVVIGIIGGVDGAPRVQLGFECRGHRVQHRGHRVQHRGIGDIGYSIEAKGT
jgi:hypothetical protein